MAPEGARITDDAAPPERQPQAIGRGPLHPSAFQLMLFAATVIIGAAAEPAPPERLFAAFVAWLVAYLSLFAPPF